MPRYDYACPSNHRFEECAGYDDETMICVCGQIATRVGVYREQYISCETGPKSAPKVEAPRDEKDLRKPFREFREASQEMEYAYSRVDDPNVKAPDLYHEGLKQAKKRNPKVRA